jgi:hypothetical protein
MSALARSTRAVNTSVPSRGMAGYEVRTAKLVAGCVGAGVLVCRALVLPTAMVWAATAPPAASVDDRKKARRFIEIQS